MAVDQDWRYLEVPLSQDISAAMNTQENMEGASLAPWDYCGTGSIREDDVLKALREKLVSGTCVNEESLHHMAWDVLNVASEFPPRSVSSSEPGVESAFVMTDGGLTAVSPASAAADLPSNPYNSSAYRLTVAARRPRLHVQRFVSDRIGEEIREKNDRKRKEEMLGTQGYMTVSEQKDGEVFEEEDEEDTALFFEVGYCF